VKRAIGFLFACVLCCVVQAAAIKPNFVVIVADDLGANDLHTFGHPVIQSPNIDQLARQGVQFNNAFLTTASCTASRASILTGRYPHNTGSPNLNDVLPADQKTVAAYLRAAGYYTAAIGKWHNGGLVVPQWDVVKDPPGDSGAEGWLDALRNRPKDKPFFFWFASRDPHVPYSPLPADGLYQPKDAVMLPAFLDGPDARYTIAQYYTEITRLDSYVGKVVAELRAQHLLNNTYIIFLSDNGAPLPRAKTTLHDTGIKTPLIVAGPQIPVRSQVGALVSAIDVMPTVLDLAGIAPADSMQGKSFVSLFKNPAADFRTEIFAEQSDHGYVLNRRAVRNQQYLYVHNFAENKHNCLLEAQPMGRELIKAFHEKKLNRDQLRCFNRKPPVEKLYDMQADPFALHNLVDDPALAAVRDAMRHKLLQQAKNTEDTVYLQTAH
jgi:N-sulfoglucosamine sulfohydrolase